MKTTDWATVLAIDAVVRRMDVNAVAVAEIQAVRAVAKVAARRRRAIDAVGADSVQTIAAAITRSRTPNS